MESTVRIPVFMDPLLQPGAVERKREEYRDQYRRGPTAFLVPTSSAPTRKRQSTCSGSRCASGSAHEIFAESWRRIHPKRRTWPTCSSERLFSMRAEQGCSKVENRNLARRCGGGQSALNPRRLTLWSSSNPSKAFLPAIRQAGRAHELVDQPIIGEPTCHKRCIRPRLRRSASTGANSRPRYTRRGTRSASGSSPAARYLPRHRS